MVFPEDIIMPLEAVNVPATLVAPFNDTLPVPVLNVTAPDCTKLPLRFNIPPMYKLPLTPIPPTILNAPLVVLVLLVDEFINISPPVIKEHVPPNVPPEIDGFAPMYTMDAVPVIFCADVIVEPDELKE